MSLSIAAILIGVVRQGVTARLEEAKTRLTRGCAAIEDRFDRYFVHSGEPSVHLSHDMAARELTFLLDVVLAEFDGIEGGIWSPQEGILAYAYPTYQGAAPKRDVPEAERPRILDLADKVARQGGIETQRYETKREALILHACPLTGSARNVAWTMTRVSVENYSSNAALQLGLAILFLFAVLSGAWLWFLRRRWSSR